tara:strand:+ start:342 stop:515 length:174 start_codon:yes stop_codon:yes gene_type:complete
MKDDVLEGYKTIIKMQKEEIFELKKYKSEVIQLQNLVDGYKKVITELTEIINKKNVR